VELHDLYSTPNIVWVMKFRRMRWEVGHIVHMGKRRNVYCAFVKNCEGKRPCGKPRDG
jgi:hypothetical protein